MNSDSDRALRDAVWPLEHPAPKQVIECRHCGQKNKVDVSIAAFHPDRFNCGACNKRLFLAPDEPLIGIDSTGYEHPLDRTSLKVLKAVPGFPTVVKWVVSNIGERSLKLQQMSSAIRCNDEQFPELLELLSKARKSLDIHQETALYLNESPTMNAMTAGVEKASIIVWSALLDQLDDTEVVTVLSHELGHLHANHVLYKTMARLMVEGTGLFGGYIKLFTIPLRKALLVWDRCSELTADRAALLGSRSLTASLNIFLKFAGGNRPGITRRTTLHLGPFVKQARELAEIESSSWLDNVLATLLTVNQSHPYVVWRLMHLISWIEEGDYLNILAGHYPRTER